VRECDVFGAATRLAFDYAERQFGEAERAAELEKQASLRERRRSETLYQVMPGDEPVLLDEGLYWGESARTPEGMVWAEARLTEIGFSCDLDGRVKTYRRAHDVIIVYADPRSNGSIRFHLFDEAALASKRRTPLRRGYLGNFSMLDSWRHDLPGKYVKRVEPFATRVRESR
jgi:hypothetical protein